jgi:catechol 2,3-dioxygenase
MDAKYPLTGASDHGVSEAIYMNDPDKNGIELYWDKPKEQWPVDKNGKLKMITQALDIEDLLKSAG